VVAPDGRKANQEDDVLRKRDNNFMGQQQEEELFSKLKKCFDELMVLLHIPFQHLEIIPPNFYYLLV